MIASAKRTSQTAPARAKSSGGGEYSFPKSARMLKHAGFQNVYENGRRHFSASMTFFFILSASPAALEAPAQVGITVGRVLGGAVDRNRIKRRVRDRVRHALPVLQAELAGRSLKAEIVINPKKAALTADIQLLRAEVERGFKLIAATGISRAEVSPAR